MASVRSDGVAPSRVALSALLIASAAGKLHGLFSLYWAAGGGWLLGTLGRQLVDTFADERWLLFPVAAVKITCALLPLLLARLSSPARRPWRVVCWAGAALLVVWGGINTLAGNLVLAGVVKPADGYDHEGMIGHAWLVGPTVSRLGHRTLGWATSHASPPRITLGTVLSQPGAPR